MSVLDSFGLRTCIIVISNFSPTPKNFVGGKLSPFTLHKNHISAQQDLNLLTNEGIYIAAYASQLVNGPGTANRQKIAVIFVIPYSDTVFSQIMICGNTMFTREKEREKFSEWLEIGKSVGV